jgi:flagellar basal-body rod protein FlgF
VVEGLNTVDSIRGKLRIVAFADPQSAQKQGNNLYSAAAGAAPQQDLKSTVQQGYVEKSNVNSVAEMSRMVEVMRSYTQLANMVQVQSDMRKSAIEKLADVPV